MGIFGRIGRAFSSGVSKTVSVAKNVGIKIVNTGKKVANKVVDTGKKAVSKVKEGATNVWGKFSGKEDFEKADKLYNEIKIRFEKKKATFDCEVEKITANIEKHVKSINAYKLRIKSELFTEMVQQLQKIKGIKVDKEFKFEDFKYSNMKVESVRSTSQLYTIDFNNNKFKTTFQAIFTLGFFTRKRAKETLAAVQEEEGKVNHEIAKMDVELAKLRQIEASLKNVDVYFHSLVGIYEQLLVRINNNVNFLYFQCMQFAHQLVADQMQLKHLPIVQQKEVEAIMTASKVLNKMVKTQISNVENVVDVKNFETKLKVHTTEIQNIYKAA